MTRNNVVKNYIEDISVVNIEQNRRIDEVRTVHDSENNLVYEEASV